MIKKEITLPIPLGTIAYKVHTSCGDFCLFQKELFNKIYPPNEGRCSNQSPCHTVSHNPTEIVLNLKSLEYFMSWWGVTIFETLEEAENTTKELITSHIERIKSDGFFISERGYSDSKCS